MLKGKCQLLIFGGIVNQAGASLYADPGNNTVRGNSSNIISPFPLAHNQLGP